MQRRCDMPKIDKTVQKETGYIALWVLIFSILMQATFLVIGKWDLTVLFGNLLGGALAILNFFLMGIGVQKAVRKEEKEARDLMKLSQTLRSFLVLVVVIVGIVLHCFHTVAVILPLFFPRIAVAIRPLFMKKEAGISEE